MSLFQLFRKKPSNDIIGELLTVTGFNTLDDPKKVTRSHLDTDEVIKKYLELQTKLLPYYIPCKAKKYILPNPTGKNIITIVRHFLKIKAHSIIAQEKYQSGKKVIIYRIAPKTNNKKEQHVVKFD